MTAPKSHQTIICITGGIGAGKSVISRLLRCRGFIVYDCDSAAREIMERPGSLRENLCQVVGDDIYSSDGHLDRNIMASRLFTSYEIRMKVNALVHKAVRDDIAAIAANASETDIRKSVMFVETAIPSVSKIDRMSERIWYVDAPEETRLARACRRDNADEAKIKQRMATQKSEFDALPADYTDRIINDGLTPLLPQIDNLLKHIIV